MEYQEYITDEPNDDIDIIQEVKEKLYSVFSIENLFLFWMLMISVSATTLTRSLDPRENPIGIAITVGLSAAMCYRYYINFTRSIFLIIAALAAWIAIHYYSDADFKILEYSTLFLKVALAYITVNIFRDRLWTQFHNIVYRLTLIDLGMWVTQNLLGTISLQELSFLPSTGTSLGSFLIYSVSNDTIYEGKFVFDLLRNAGFCWEPGFYACILVFAIFANFVIYEYRWRGNIELYVLIIALATTGSTTGYTAFFALLITTYILRTIKAPSSSSVTISIISLLAFAAVMQLPFMQEKIKSSNDSNNFLTEQKYGVSSLEKSDRTFTVDRIEGMTLDLLNIQDKPWTGYGTLTNSYVYNNVSEHIRISNGITFIFAVYGIPFACLIFLLIGYSSRILRKDYPLCNSSWLIVLLVTSVSYNFLNYPLFIAFSLFYVLQVDLDEDTDEEEEDDTEEIEATTSLA